MKKFLVIAGLLLIAGGAAIALAQGVKEPVSYKLHYKMTVTVDTPEGEVRGSAVHEISNGVAGNFPPGTGNPAGVKGEAVVVDMGKRGVLFALISHESDNRFYDAFPLPGHDDGQGGSSPAGIKHFANIPLGTRGVLDPAEPPGYPELVTFKDMNDPKSVTLAQVWEQQENGLFKLKADHMEELFGEGVKLKDITLEITDEPVTWGVVDGFLPKTFDSVVVKNWRKLSKPERQKLVDIVTFKQGEEK